jgi:hypothetical protein
MPLYSVWCYPRFNMQTHNLMVVCKSSHKWSQHKFVSKLVAPPTPFEISWCWMTPLENNPGGAYGQLVQSWRDTCKQHETCIFSIRKWSMVKERASVELAHITYSLLFLGFTARGHIVTTEMFTFVMSVTFL